MKARLFVPVLSVIGLVVVIVAAIVPASSLGADPPTVMINPQPPTTAERRPVDLVICLDTSDSMRQLLDSARAKLWSIVSELAMAKPTPQLRVGLLTYGSPNNSTADEGYIVHQIDLTTDLDAVYAKMMAMRTNGGDEYVGWVLNDALSRMSWSNEPDALKIVCVAGNESADQAAHRYNFRQVGQMARVRGIVINAFYAGEENRGTAEFWDQVATAGQGYYAAINMHTGTIQIATPHDDELERLNRELNDTYLPYGAKGDAGAANQVAQDANAVSLGAESAGDRAVAKATALYDSGGWDLVDAARDKDFDVAEVKEEELPEAMKPMSPEERQSYVAGMRQARAAVQEKIQQVSAARRKYLEAERAKRGGGTSLDAALRQAVRRQASERNFEFEEQDSKPQAGEGAPVAQEQQKPTESE